MWSTGHDDIGIRDTSMTVASRVVRSLVLMSRVFPVDLNVTSRHEDSHVVVVMAGEIDLHTAPRLQNELADQLHGGAKHVIVDMSGVEFCDSTGVNVLLAALRRANEHGGSLCLVGPQPAVRKVLGITGLDSVFPLRPSVQDAMDNPPVAGEEAAS